MRSAELVSSREVRTEVERFSPREIEYIPSIFIREHRELGYFEAVSAIELLGIAWNSRGTSAEHAEEREDAFRSFDGVLRSLLAALHFNQRLETSGTP
jgi:hypothetical protein